MASATEKPPAIARLDSPLVSTETKRGPTGRQVYLANLRHNMLLHAELERVVHRARQANIDVAVLKGTALMLRVHGDLGRRAVADIDLLVRPNRFTQLASLLQVDGYRALPDVGRYDVVFQRPVPDRTCIELHRSLGYLPRSARSLDSDVWDRMRKSSEPGFDVRILDPIDEVLQLCLNVAKHSFSQVHLGEELYLAVEAWADRLSLQAMADRAGRYGLTHTVAMALAWSQVCAGRPLPLAIPPALELRGWKRAWFERIDWRGRPHRLPVPAVLEMQTRLLARYLVLDQSTGDRLARLTYAGRAVARRRD